MWRGFDRRDHGNGRIHPAGGPVGIEGVVGGLEDSIEVGGIEGGVSDGGPHI